MISGYARDDIHQALKDAQPWVLRGPQLPDSAKTLPITGLGVAWRHMETADE